MSWQVSRGSAGEYQADELAGVARLSWRADMIDKPVVKAQNYVERVDTPVQAAAVRVCPVAVQVGHVASVADVAENVGRERQVVEDVKRALHADHPVRFFERAAYDAQSPVWRQPRRVQDLQRLPVDDRPPAAEAGVRDPLLSDAVPEAL